LPAGASVQNYSKDIGFKQSANTAHSRLLALRGEGLAPNISQSSPAHYCILSSVRRIKLALSNYELQPQILPIIIGPSGSGKSALANHLRCSLPNSSSFLTGTTGLNVNNLIKHIALAGDISISSAISSEDRLNDLVEQLKLHNRTLTVLIDKADSLSVTCLAAIVHLVSYQRQQKNLTIVLFGYQDLSDKLSSLIGNNLQCVQLKTIPLLPLTSDEVKVYMGACLKASGIKINRFKLDDSLVLKIRKLSNGLPGNIQNLLATEIIPHLKLEDDSLSLFKSKRCLSFLLLLVMFVYMQHYAFRQNGLMQDYQKFSSLVVHDLANILV
jgi:type II secretory pathway predicted ATPase ExeA